MADSPDYSPTSGNHELQRSPLNPVIILEFDSSESDSLQPPERVYHGPWTPYAGVLGYTDTPAQSEDSNSNLAISDESSRATSHDAATRDDESLGEPPVKVRRLSSPKRSDDADGETCPICLDSWGNSGEHRLVSLKCGHLFGAQCVERWLRAQAVKERSCPTCKSKASLKDIRFIYAKRLVAADISQITALQKQLNTLQAAKSRVDLELEKSKIAHQACMQQLEVLRSTLMKGHGVKEQAPRRSWRFALEKNLEISKDGGCRVLTYNCRTYDLYVSQKSTNSLFPGYGIRKVSCVDYKPGQFVHLHPKPIRDITYSQPRDLLLSVGLDGSARVLERGIPGASVACGMPLWSCSWDHMRSHEFYVGGVGGAVHQYDVRNPGAYLRRLVAPGDLSPVVSLCSTEHGLLACQLNSCWLWAAGADEWEPRALPLEPPFMSLCYDEDSRRALVASRPSGLERSKLTLCRVRAGAVDVEQSFAGSSRAALMSRPAYVRVPDAAWVAAHSESDGSLLLHGLDGVRTLALPASEPALDVCAPRLHADTLLAALSDSRLRLYKAVPTG
ncbi:E3 ubiquitin-protein ligase RFWD3-like [Leptidea sinapis]|uniref:E3 ubiquitin-protein ligase RFWD3-like n=1 Tax=Leptidea sinapis TaxID=189913 RepID=UPI0021C3FF97|nr:E3 ubiquitin-protein ligase RFWD3-like [Leptidea sinapis]